MYTYTLSDGQNLTDVAMQCYGSAAALAWLVEDNPELAAADFRTYSGLQLIIKPERMTDTTFPVEADAEAVEYYNATGHTVNTGNALVPFAEFNDDFSTDFDI